MVDVIRRGVTPKATFACQTGSLIWCRRVGGAMLAVRCLLGPKNSTPYYIIISVSERVSVQKCTSYARPRGVVGSSEMADPSGSSVNNGLYSILSILQAPPPLRAGALFGVSTPY